VSSPRTGMTRLGIYLQGRWIFAIAMVVYDWPLAVICISLSLVNVIVLRWPLGRQELCRQASGCRDSCRQATLGQAARASAR